MVIGEIFVCVRVERVRFCQPLQAAGQQHIDHQPPDQRSRWGKVTAASVIRGRICKTIYRPLIHIVCIFQISRFF